MKSSGLKLSFSKPCCPRLFASLVNSIADASSQEGEPFFYSYGRLGAHLEGHLWMGEASSQERRKLAPCGDVVGGFYGVSKGDRFEELTGLFRLNLSFIDPTDLCWRMVRCLGTANVAHLRRA